MTTLHIHWQTATGLNATENHRGWEKSQSTLFARFVSEKSEFLQSEARRYSINTYPNTHASLQISLQVSMAQNTSKQRERLLITIFEYREGPAVQISLGKLPWAW